MQIVCDCGKSCASLPVDPKPAAGEWAHFRCHRCGREYWVECSHALVPTITRDAKPDSSGGGVKYL